MRPTGFNCSSSSFKFCFCYIYRNTPGAARTLDPGSHYLARSLARRRYATTFTSRSRSSLPSKDENEFRHTKGKREATHPFPFPSHPRPTPYEIFHLPLSASAAEIKSRYYDLVRYHHPDSPHARLHTPSAEERHSRFHSILSAYNSLRFPSSEPYNSRGSGSWAHYGHGSGFDPYVTELNRRRRASMNAELLRRKQRMKEDEEREKEQEEHVKHGGSRRDKLMLSLAVLALVGGLYPNLFFMPFRMERQHQDAVVNLAHARNDARIFGQIRMEEVKKRVKDIKAARALQQEQEEGQEDWKSR